MVVVDLDPKNFETPEAFALLCDNCDVSPDDLDTYTVRTRTYPSGAEGLHLYFSCNPALNLRPRIKHIKGIDVLGNGHFVVGPGSIHPDTKKPYIVINGHPSNLKPLPQGIIDVYERKGKTVDAVGDGSVTPYECDDEKTRARFISFLESRQPAVQGDSGDEWTFKTACIGKDYGLPEATVLELMLEHFNPKCVPAWSPDKMADKVSSAFRNGRLPQGLDHPVSVFEPIDGVPAPSDAEAEFQRRYDEKESEQQALIQWQGKKHGADQFAPWTLRNTIHNVIEHFRVPHHKTYENHLFRLVRYNSFTHQVEFTRPAIWHKTIDSLRVQTWSEGDTTHLSAWFSTHRRWNPSPDMIGRGVWVVAHRNSHNPVRDRLNSLVWDGVSRVEKMMHTYTGAEDNDYSSLVSRCLMVSAVARIMQPGCKVDQTVILEGTQGSGKSTFCRILGGEYFATLHLDPRNKDTAMALRGKHIIELPEMTHLRQSQVEMVKAFLTTEVDYLRLPYGKTFDHFPRQCIFIGTTNETGEYLPDPTGNRRFLPISTTLIEMTQLAIDVDQLYAEALVMFRAGVAWYPSTEYEVRLSKHEQSLRQCEDVWVNDIKAWLAEEQRYGRVHARLSSTDIMKFALGIPTSKVNRYEYTRLSNAMASIGWATGQIKISTGANVRGYRNPNYKQELENLTRGL